ncbi:MAG: tRNA guanosine(34) transglycosylase Tgt [Thermaerobacter sp.]|nr:tRNA guanosine(34) transglycosylase Tgt [Thermaerobacter sp.]
MSLSFRVTARDGLARTGVLTTPHAAVETPAFLPVGTQGSVKGLDPQELTAMGARLLLANTYHLYLRPGAGVVRRLGGLHRFMQWPGGILTDSGGFQILSLSSLRQVDDQGVVFRSHLDGSLHALTPEGAVAIQEELGADIITVLDECLPYPVEEARAADSVRRTLDWARRCRESHRTDQALFAIVQGATFPRLRRRCAEELAALDFPGYAVGGLSVGEPKELTWEVLGETTAHLPPEKPRYLMGVGEPADLLAGVATGVDLFDCVLPTRLGRHGMLLTARGRLSVRSARFAQDASPPDPDCGCTVCRRFSRAYLRHLFRSGELLGPRLASQHNVYFLLRLMAQARDAIRAGSLAEFTGSFLAHYRENAWRKGCVT